MLIAAARGCLAHEMSEFDFLPHHRARHAAAPGFARRRLPSKEVAALSAAAENPLIITNCAGRDPEGVDGARASSPNVTRSRRSSTQPSHVDSQRPPDDSGYGSGNPRSAKRRRDTSPSISGGALVAGDQQSSRARDAKVIHMERRSAARLTRRCAAILRHRARPARRPRMRVLNETMAEHEARREAAHRQSPGGAGAEALAAFARRLASEKLAEVQGQSPIHPGWIDPLHR